MTEDKVEQHQKRSQAPSTLLHLFGLERLSRVDQAHERELVAREQVAHVTRLLHEARQEHEQYKARVEAEAQTQQEENIRLAHLLVELDKKLAISNKQRDELNRENAALHKTASAMQVEYTRVQKAYAEAEQAQASLTSTLVECRQEREKLHKELAEVKQAGPMITEPLVEEADEDAAQGEEVTPAIKRGRPRKAG